MSPRYPALDGASDVPFDIIPLATYYNKALRAIQPQGPYILGGWSMGGIIAFEMAQQLMSGGGLEQLPGVEDALRLP